MDDGNLVICAVVVGAGTLAFLKIVSNEIVFQLRALELRTRAEQEERRRENARRQQKDLQVAKARPTGQALEPDENSAAA